MAQPSSDWVCLRSHLKPSAAVVVRGTRFSPAQDGDFSELPDNPDFKLTLEKPTKFGYSPSYVGNAGGAEGTGGVLSFEDMPAFAPGLFRFGTAPASAVGLSVCLEPVRKGSSGGGFEVEGSGGGGGALGEASKLSRHSRRGPFTDNRLDSLGSAAEWDQTFTGEGGWEGWRFCGGWGGGGDSLHHGRRSRSWSVVLRPPRLPPPYAMALKKRFAVPLDSTHPQASLILLWLRRHDLRWFRLHLRGLQPPLMRPSRVVLRLKPRPSQRHPDKGR